MRMFIKRLVILLILTLQPVWSLNEILRTYSQLDVNRLISQRLLSNSDIVFLTHASLLVAWILLISLLSISLRNIKTNTGTSHSQNHVRLFTPAVWLVTAVAISPQVQSTTSNAVSQEVPASVVVSPAVAAAVLSHVLKIRREQIKNKKFPKVLSESELATLALLHNQASKISSPLYPTEQCEIPEDLHTDIAQLLSAIEKTEPLKLSIGVNAFPEWVFVVKVFGFPVVEHSNGQVAVFRKKRSLELLTWLTMNRDRSRRSAARTAMWEYEINDSTFSTILSELRRALVEIEKDIPREEWARPTFSDDIPLNNKIVTDADLLSSALCDFRIGKCEVSEVVKYLVWVRDVPFAGTSYSWADLDGTTTRLVILAVTAATEVAQWATDHEKIDILNIAVGAGLRVMPGCEELLRLQNKALPRSRNPRVVSVA